MAISARGREFSSKESMAALLEPRSAWDINSCFSPHPVIFQEELVAHCFDKMLLEEAFYVQHIWTHLTGPLVEGNAANKSGSFYCKVHFMLLREKIEADDSSCRMYFSTDLSLRKIYLRLSLQINQGSSESEKYI